MPGSLRLNKNKVNLGSGPVVHASLVLMSGYIQRVGEPVNNKRLVATLPSAHLESREHCVTGIRDWRPHDLVWDLICLVPYLSPSESILKMLAQLQHALLSPGALAKQADSWGPSWAYSVRFCMFSSFSGELMWVVCGPHSEMMTGLKHAPGTNSLVHNLHIYCSIEK